MNGLFNLSLEQKKPISIMYMADDHTITDRSVIVRKIDKTHIYAYCLKRQQMRKFKRSSILAAGKAPQRRMAYA
ncbi:hypothetical protein L2D08_14515 [Domibacillus sp. PGB-M46]|uniref:hypothetical protein n=1 Tax=Domibacillus sp. PGB-M46 TaxID=2910255 RepID=UPI001F5A3A6D|nr:hypothetical protein [Domibacillus sp. PGB-M46]MCI2255583.1 hypothetical protein [Domibacillus sp. PGB-M46]